MATIDPEAHRASLPGVVQNPLEEAKSYLLGKVDTGEVDRATFVRADYTHDCEHGVNVQLNSYFNCFHIYTSMAAYFARDSVALPGIASFFKASAGRAKTDALHMLDYQNMRGGKVMLKALSAPDLEYMDDAKGDALQAFEIALALERLNFSKLRELHKTARDANDPEMQDFVNTKLHEQALVSRELGNYVCQLKRVGQGLPVFMFDTRIKKRHGLTLSAVVKVPLA